MPKKEQQPTRKIVDFVNKINQTNISDQTVRDCIKRGLQKVLPVRGRKPLMPVDIDAALISAIVSYISLGCAGMTENPDRQDIVHKLGVLLKTGPTHLTDPVALHQRLFPKYANDVVVTGEDSKQEARRAKWTTYYHINAWFDSLKKFLIDKGFAREKRHDELAEGEFVYHEN